jgi:hypothetical protein
VQVTDSFSLAARKSEKVSATLTIPSNAEPGGHYGVIRFSGQAPEIEGSGVGLAASAGTLILVRVSGQVDEKLDLLTFSASRDGTLSGFFENGPLTFVVRTENKGNVHVKPSGQIEIRDMFGNKVETLKVNDVAGNVLPGSIRRFEATLDKQWLFGRYTADLAIGYGTNGQAITRTISFWVIPYKLIMIGLLALVTIVFILRTLIRRYNRYIINKARQSETHHKKKRK